MRILIRYFFRAVRLIMHPFMLLWEKLTTPKGMVRAPEAQQLVDLQTKGLVMYQFKTCPFCIKARREIRRLSLDIELRDAQHDQQNRQALLQGGGRVQVPCLKITDESGKVEWLYESGAIIQYLQKFA